MQYAGADAAGSISSSLGTQPQMLVIVGGCRPLAVVNMSMWTETMVYKPAAVQHATSGA